MASENTKDWGVKVTAGESRERDATNNFRPWAITNVYHSEDGKTPEAIGKACMEEESFRSIRESAPLMIDTSKLPVSTWHIAFHGDVRRAAYCGEGGAKEYKVIVYSNASGLVPKWGDGIEDVGPC